MSLAFAEMSYLSQVRLLRKLAAVAIQRYALKVTSIKFINHGENATFKVEAKGGEKFLLRLHREGYHTKEAISDEIHWLKKLTSLGIRCPEPVISKKRSLVETVSHGGITRNCSLLRWNKGRFLDTSASDQRLFQIGKFIATLHQCKTKMAHRKYWTADGLAGNPNRFGSLESLSDVSSKMIKTLVEARKAVFRDLKRYEKKFPSRMGSIHADFHFGNLLFSKGEVVAIDFDDCGYGFYVYDLVTTYISLKTHLKIEDPKKLALLKESLLAGYSSVRPLDSHDKKVFDRLVTARILLMLVWLHSRSDNPRLKKYMKLALSRAMKHLKSIRQKR